MLVSSLAVLALAASTAVSPVSKSVHLHTAQLDSRIHVTLHNDGRMFQDVKVDGRSYTIIPQHGISIKAPAGTIIYADSSTGEHRRGDVLLEVNSEVQNKIVGLK